jgi:hypothetical protein
MPKWVIPLVILSALIVLNMTRWENGPKFDVTDGAMQYEYDRWTGQHWLQGYGWSILDGTKYREIPLNDNGPAVWVDAATYRNNLTLAWDVITGLVFIWLLISIYLSNKTNFKSDLKG